MTKALYHFRFEPTTIKMDLDYLMKKNNLPSRTATLRFLIKKECNYKL